MTDNTIAARVPVQDTSSSVPASADSATFAVILSLGFCHLLNDMMQSMVPALYPILKDSHALDFAQIGLITLAFQCTASLLQPLVGIYADRRPMPYSLASFSAILLAAALIGVGSAVFHPEASRVARMASGGRHGLAQSMFQVGGNIGSAIGPLLAAFVVVPAGQSSIVWFSAAALVAMATLVAVGNWYTRNRHLARPKPRAADGGILPVLTRGRVALAIAVLILLMFSKSVYSASLGSYYTFYLIEKFGVSVQTAQVALFVFLAAIVVGTLAGGWIGDKIGRIPVMWFSILGVLPFTLALPYAGLIPTLILSIAIGLIMASAFSAIIVYAQDLLPGRVGMVAGIFFGVSFGLGGLGAAALGKLADLTDIDTVYKVCSYLPLFGLLIAFLPRIEKAKS
jgi:FSR family fosmidomycin resistance protein-like MFS transporter